MRKIAQYTQLASVLLVLFSFQAAAALPSFFDDAPMPSLAPMLDKVTPAVVNIATKSHIQVRENPLLRDPFFRRFFNIPNQPRKRSTQSLGSGVIIDAKKGYILTNHHVIDKADEITVTLRDGRHFSAKIVGSDPESDVSVIQIKAEKLVALKVANSDKLRVGDFVVAIGNPFGLGQTVTSGIISALGRSGLGIEGYEDFIQTDASINPGNSGGALVNLRGELIGINTAIIAPSGGNVGIGFAIPSNMAISLKKQLVKFGVVRRGQLGITVQDLTPELAQAFKLGTQQGVVISGVEKGSSADSAKLRSGDIILAVNGRKIQSSTRLRNTLGLLSVGETARLKILRNGKKRTVKLKIGKRKIVSIQGEKIHPELAGATLVNLTSRDLPRHLKAAIGILDVKRNSKAWNVGLRKSDIIAKANRLIIHNINDFKKATKGRKTLLLNIQRGNDAFLILVR